MKYTPATQVYSQEQESPVFSVPALSVEDANRLTSKRAAEEVIRKKEAAALAAKAEAIVVAGNTILVDDIRDAPLAPWKQRMQLAAPSTEGAQAAASWIARVEKEIWGFEWASQDEDFGASLAARARAEDRARQSLAADTPASGRTLLTLDVRRVRAMLIMVFFLGVLAGVLGLTTIAVIVGSSGA